MSDPVLAIGATGRIGRAVLGRLLAAAVPVSALLHCSESAWSSQGLVDRR